MPSAVRAAIRSSRSARALSWTCIGNMCQELRPPGGGLAGHSIGSDVCEVVFEAWRHDVVSPGGADLAEAVEGIPVEPVRAHHARTCSDFGIARHDHAAFAGGDRLAGVEAENAGIRVQRTDQAAVK